MISKVSAFTTHNMIVLTIHEVRKQREDPDFCCPVMQKIRKMESSVSQILEPVERLLPASAFIFDCEVNAASSAGRGLITFIFPSKDWVSFLWHTNTGRYRGGFHGCYLEDENLDSASAYIEKIVDAFSEEMFLGDNSLRITHSE